MCRPIEAVSVDNASNCGAENNSRYVDDHSYFECALCTVYASQYDSPGYN